MPNISIIIPAYIKNQNLFEITKKALDGLYRTSGIQGHEIILVDDCSDKKYILFLSKLFPQIKIITNPTNMGFACSVNAGINASKHDLILLLNNDVEILDTDWLDRMVKTMDDNNWDMTGPKQRYFDKNWNLIPSDKIINKNNINLFCYLEGFCVLIKRVVFEKVGLFATDMYPGFFEDTLFSYYVQRNTDFKMGLSEKIGIKHLVHKTFLDQNYNLSKEYNEKRQIFLDFLSGKRQPTIPRLEPRNASKI